MASRPLVQDHIAQIQPYVPGKPIEELRRERNLTGEILKMASNENPLGASPLGLEAAHRALSEAHLYPDARAWALVQRIAAELHVAPEQLVVGNGSDELMDLLVRTFGAPGDEGMISAYSFASYPINLQAAGLKVVTVPTRAPLTHDLAAMGAAVTPKTRLVFVGNPNNPTGTYNPGAELAAFLGRLSDLPDPPVVALDEAYFEYADAPDYASGLPLLASYPRLVVLRTFSKAYGLASLRIGYLVTHPELASYLHRVRKTFNVNRIAQAAALAALDDHDFLRRTVELNRVERARVTEALRARGHEVIPSQANFLLCRFPRPGREVFDALLNLGIITRPVDNYGLQPYLRISLGTAPQNDRLLAALDQVLR